jgi:hypothetical protein
MTPDEVARLRLRAQRVEDSELSQPEQVVAWLGAVQAQDYLGALWGIGLRMKAAREQTVEEALAARRIVRTWPMRGTLHFVAAADVRWLTELLAPRMVSRAAGRLRALGIDDATLTRARRVLEKGLAGGPVTRPAVYALLERGKVATTGQRGIHILWRLAHDGVLCFGPREGKQHSFALLDQWVPSSPRVPREEALAELAGRYFRGHGPATTADFAWWSGLGLNDARRGVEAAGRALVREVADGREHWCHAGTTRTATSRRPRAHLLPAFDELLVGFADRTAVLDAKLTRRVNTGGGIFFPVMLAGARVVGTWKRGLSATAVTFRPEPFARLPAATRRMLDEAFARYAAFLGRAAQTAAARSSRMPRPVFLRRSVRKVTPSP